MKKKCLIFGFFVVSIANVSAQQLLVTVENIDSSQKGALFIGIYDNSKTFTRVGSQKVGKNVPVTDKTSETVIIEGLPLGTYSISVFHDKNNNEKLDKTWFGLPKEGYGFSNNVFGWLGPPNFEVASFTVEAHKTTELSIKLKY